MEWPAAKTTFTIMFSALWIQLKHAVKFNLASDTQDC
jgi:hypothetical protein